jgi:DNA-binding MarR family transcriptional regulator
MDMDQLATNFKRYFKETLDIDARPKQWPGTGNLPIFLRNTYVFFEVRILEMPCLVMATKDKTEQTPATIRKHMLQVRKKWQDEVIYVQQKVTAYNRKRLIQHKVPFVVPLNQMYLPFLGIDLREHFKNIRETEANFSPSTQVVVLYYLSQNGQLRLTPKTLANALGYSIMTMTRALDELDGAGLGTISMEGRERVLQFNQDKRQVWETALERLRSPVKKRVWVKAFSNKPVGVKAGLSALAHYSNLAEPVNPVLALDGKQWKTVQTNNGVMILDIAEPNASELEVWRYSPKLFANKGVVDRFSLFLSTSEDNDERVQSALKSMMEQVEW